MLQLFRNAAFAFATALKAAHDRVDADHEIDLHEWADNIFDEFKSSKSPNATIGIELMDPPRVEVALKVIDWIAANDDKLTSQEAAGLEFFDLASLRSQMIAVGYQETKAAILKSLSESATLAATNTGIEVTLEPGRDGFPCLLALVHIQRNDTLEADPSIPGSHWHVDVIRGPTLIMSYGVPVPPYGDPAKVVDFVKGLVSRAASPRVEIPSAVLKNLTDTAKTIVEVLRGIKYVHNGDQQQRQDLAVTALERHLNAVERFAKVVHEFDAAPRQPVAEPAPVPPSTVTMPLTVYYDLMDAQRLMLEAYDQYNAGRLSHNSVALTVDRLRRVRETVLGRLGMPTP